MSLAKQILEKIKKGESSANSLGALDKKAMSIVASLVKEDGHSDNDAQAKMVENMGKLAEMDSEVANNFMKAVDASASAYEMPKEKDEAKKSEEEDEEEDGDDKKKKSQEEADDDKKKKSQEEEEDDDDDKEDKSSDEKKYKKS